MKMDWQHEELAALAEDESEVLKKKLDYLIEHRGSDVTLKQMLDARNEVFYGAYRSFANKVENGGYSYDFEQFGRFSNYLYDRLEAVWLEYVL